MVGLPDARYGAFAMRLGEETLRRTPITEAGRGRAFGDVDYGGFFLPHWDTNVTFWLEPEKWRTYLDGRCVSRRVRLKTLPFEGMPDPPQSTVGRVIYRPYPKLPPHQ